MKRIIFVISIILMTSGLFAQSLFDTIKTGTLEEIQTLICDWSVGTKSYVKTS